MRHEVDALPLPHWHWMGMPVFISSGGNAPFFCPSPWLLTGLPSSCCLVCPLWHLLAASASFVRCSMMCLVLVSLLMPFFQFCILPSDGPTSTKIRCAMRGALRTRSIRTCLASGTHTGLIFLRASYAYADSLPLPLPLPLPLLLPPRPPFSLLPLPPAAPNPCAGALIRSQSPLSAAS
jgi:hypothetical protein